MLRTSIALLLLFTASGLRAQSVTPKNFNNDVSLFADMQLFSDVVNANAQGIHFRYQHSPMIAWRLSGGHFTYEEQGGTTILAPFSKDSVGTRRQIRNMEGAFLGGGVEAQRQFFRKVYLYAGAEVHIGYGVASVDTAFSYKYFGPSPFPPDTAQYLTTSSFGRAAKDGSGIMASATFLLGARVFVGKRFIIGTEFSNPVYYTNSKTGDESGRRSNLSLSTSQVTQRFYVSYRFH